MLSSMRLSVSVILSTARHHSVFRGRRGSILAQGHSVLASYLITMSLLCR